MNGVVWPTIVNAICYLENTNTPATADWKTRPNLYQASHKWSFVTNRLTFDEMREAREVKLVSDMICFVM